MSGHCNKDASHTPMRKIFGIGHPLIDMQAEAEERMLCKYRMEPGGACLATEFQRNIFADLAAMPSVRYLAGGSVQNSIRVAQWMLQTPGMTTLMGSVGSDDFASIMLRSCKHDGVEAMYTVDPDALTGCCAVLIVDGERSMCTALGAANSCQVQHLRRPENWQRLQDADISFTAGFFIKASPESIKLIAEEMTANGKIFAMSLGAPFIMLVPSLKSVLVETMPYIDFLFGNEQEAKAWAESENWETADLGFVATRISLIPSMKANKRTVVITRGREPTIVCTNGYVTLHPIRVLEDGKLFDTNGAGDAYTGGFLAALARGCDIPKCCDAGAYAASVVVQHHGPSFPESCGYTW